MNSVYITPDRYAGIGDLGICLPQTELRRGSIIQVASFKLKNAQRAVIRMLSLHVVSVLTPGIVPNTINSSFGICTVGVYGPVNSWGGNMICSPIVSAVSAGLGVAALNPYIDNSIESPGIYVVNVFNNTGRGTDGDYAIDLSVAVTGQIKFYV